MSLPWENFLAVLELLILVCSSAFTRGSTIVGVLELYPMDTAERVHSPEYECH